MVFKINFIFWFCLISFLLKVIKIVLALVIEYLKKI